MGVNADIPIYMNKDLMLDIYSISIDGYIESRAIRCIEDNINNLKIQNSCKDGKNSGRKKANNNKEKSLAKDISTSYNNEFVAGVDGRRGTRNEISIKKIYTNFQIFNNLKDIMIRENSLVSIQKRDIATRNIFYDKYTEVEGSISSISTVSQINCLIDILEAYGCKDLDTLLKDKKEKGLTNYSVILTQLKNLNNCLTKNSTVSMIIDCDGFEMVLNVNLNNFLNKSTYMYDHVGCYCKVLCKIINTVNENEYIDLLCKTCTSDYYNKFLDNMYPYLDILSENNILVPNEITTKIEGPAVEAIPIAIYV
ncbi:hypothetical protein RBU49_09380 [Clostridium sp. MB40-C1]|uniref:DUF6414 family protein n=1 Tax=Clostridium sp. MB40-C1 TaxID=3070996 RepID=UPI0027DF904B|nr:hypothetical protein [Clostridium sp. MB40-C1]WMJ79103.1 hypothetical protein RBU49_09380 [Clostridium sp. MB40-C1]